MRQSFSSSASKVCNLRWNHFQKIWTLRTTVNYLHPFREGNGRTQRLFFRQLAERFGYHLDFSAVDSELMMLATIHAASGVLDTLLHVFDQIITKERPEAVKPCSKIDWVEA